MSDRPATSPADRIAAAVDRLRAGPVAVNATTEGTVIRYAVTHPRYMVGLIVDPARFLGLEFDLLGPDGAVRLHYFVDSGRYDISRPAHAWYAEATATDIVLFLDALSAGRILTRIDQRRAAMIIPTGAGQRIVKRGRVWTATGRDSRDLEAATRAGFQPLAH